MNKKWNKIGLPKQQIFQDDKEHLYVYQHPDRLMNITHGMPLYLVACYGNFTFFDVIPCSLQRQQSIIRSFFLTGVLAAGGGAASLLFRALFSNVFLVIPLWGYYILYWS